MQYNYHTDRPAYRLLLQLHLNLGKNLHDKPGLMQEQD